jgi:hypothetical protein
LVAASEVASWVYCPEQWLFQYELGLAQANRAALAAGTRHHAWKAIAERFAGVVISLGRVLVIIAVMLLVLWLVWR